MNVHFHFDLFMMKLLKEKAKKEQSEGKTSKLASFSSLSHFRKAAGQSSGLLLWPLFDLGHLDCQKDYSRAYIQLKCLTSTFIPRWVFMGSSSAIAYTIVFQVATLFMTTFWKPNWVQLNQLDI